MFDIKEIDNTNRKEVNNFLIEHWFSTNIISRGKIIDGTSLDGFIAYYNNEIVGLVTYLISNDECEILSLDSLKENNGIGTLLLEKVINKAKEKKCKKIFLITTNDNIYALSFYQKRGFTFSNIYIDSMKNSRALKPEIPIIGYNNIPIRDELELEIKL